MTLPHLLTGTVVMTVETGQEKTGKVVMAQKRMAMVVMDKEGTATVDSEVAVKVATAVMDLEILLAASMGQEIGRMVMMAVDLR